jgi:hypothetical protein
MTIMDSYLTILNNTYRNNATHIFNLIKNVLTRFVQPKYSMKAFKRPYIKSIPNRKTVASPYLFYYKSILDIKISFL